MYDTVIFDLDGTLLNTLDDLCDSTNYALKTHGMPARTIEEVRQFVGNGIRKLIERAVPQVDVRTAFNTGLDMVAVLWGFRDKEVLTEAGATRFIEQPSQLLHYL